MEEVVEVVLPLGDEVALVVVVEEVRYTLYISNYFICLLSSIPMVDEL